MLPLSGSFSKLVRTVLRHLPLSDYQKTRLWATSLPRPIGPVKGWPYYRCIDLAVHTLATGYGGFHFPQSDSYSVLEFGVANGNGFQLMLHCRDTCLRKHRVDKKVLGIGFDSFEGMPAPREGDDALIWRKGDLPGDFESLQRILAARFKDFRLIKGFFADSLSKNRDLLRESPPLFVSIDCDYYSSTMDVMEVLLPDLAPHGCLFYFDDVSINFYSDRTGEVKAIKEVNEGRFGSHIQLVEYPLWIETGEMRHYKQIYRLCNLEQTEKQQQAIRPTRALKHAPRQKVLSPL